MFTLDHYKAGLCSHSELKQSLNKQEDALRLDMMGTDSPVFLARCQAELANLEMQRTTARAHNARQVAVLQDIFDSLQAVGV